MSSGRREASFQENTIPGLVLAPTSFGKNTSAELAHFTGTTGREKIRIFLSVVLPFYWDISKVI